MKALQPFPQCVDSLMSLAKKSPHLAAAGDLDLATKAEATTRKILRDVKDTGLSSPQIANRIIKEVQQLTGVYDPYVEFKAQEMAQAQRWAKWRTQAPNPMISQTFVSAWKYRKPTCDVKDHCPGSD